MRTPLLLLIALLISTVSPRADAFVLWCVNSEASLRAALQAGQTNGDDDYIHIEQGVYVLGAGLSFVSLEPFNLVLLGGWDPGCNYRAGSSTLDGQGTFRPLFVVTDTGRLFIDHVDFRLGYAESSGGGLYFASTSGNATIQLSRFTGNRSLASGGGLYARTSTGNLFVYNNVFQNNRANEVGGAILDQGGDGRLINNTIYGNTTDVLTVPSGVLLRGNGLFGASNNLIWNNAGVNGADFRADTEHYRQHNNIEFVAGSVAPGSVVGEISVEPQLANCSIVCIAFDLKNTSPLVDAGSDAALDDLGPGLIDLRDKPRRLGPDVDIGAYEFDGQMFADGFEP
jgi:hypothetical protein